MSKSLLVAAGLAAALTTFAATKEAHATNYSLWIHGRSSTPSGFSYWTHSGYAGNGIAAGVNPVAVNYDGTQHISATNGVIVNALNTYCTGANSCYVACHSAGCAQLGYAFAYSNPGTWHVIWVAEGGSAEGGSELANVGSWLTGWNIDSDLHTGTMRAMYNHDLVGDHIQGWMYPYLGGDWSTLTNVFFPCNSSFLGVCYSWAANDSVVAFHSSGRFRSTGGWQSDSDYNTTTHTTGGSWYDWSDALWVDANNGVAGHCVIGAFLGACQEGTTAGVMGVVRGTMAAYAD
jgi:hypothetical protein